MRRLLPLALSVACARGTCEHGNWSGCAAARAATPGAERVALLLTGLIRTFDITHPRLRAEFVVPLERRGAVVDVFVQTSAEVICGIREAFNPVGRDVCPERANATARRADMAAAIRRLAAPNLRFLDLSANATRERKIERMTHRAAHTLRTQRSGDLNNNYLKHGNQAYKAHQYWRMDAAREAAEAYARADPTYYGAAARAWTPFNYSWMAWTRLDVLLTNIGRRSIVSIDQEDKRHVSEERTFQHYAPPPDAPRALGDPATRASLLTAVPGSFGRSAAFSRWDYDWFVYGAPAAMAVWTGQWRLADTPCAALWSGCGLPPENRTAPPRAPLRHFGGDERLWNGHVCNNEPFECRLTAVLYRRNMTFQFLKDAGFVAAIVRMPEKAPETGAYAPDIFHRPIGTPDFRNSSTRSLSTSRASTRNSGVVYPCCGVLGLVGGAPRGETPRIAALGRGMLRLRLVTSQGSPYPSRSPRYA